MYKPGWKLNGLKLLVSFKFEAGVAKKKTETYLRDYTVALDPLGSLVNSSRTLYRR